MPRRCLRRGQSLHVPVQFSHKAAPRTVALLAWEPQGETVQLRCQKSQLFGGTGRGLDGRLPQVLIKRTLVTQAHRLPPPSPQRSGHSQRLADTCGQMGPCVVSIYPPRGPPHILLQEGSRGRQPGTPAPNEHAAPAAPRIPKTHWLRGCLWPEDVWTVGLWRVSPRRREEGEARGHSSAPRPHHPSTHPSPASGSEWTCLTAS